jgi:hypothetical protein
VPLFVVLGCGKEPDPPVDTNEAGAALRTALDAWKAGEPYGGLPQRDPAIYFNERDWEAGKRLVDYRLGPVELMGRQGRCTVKLTVRDKDGKQADRDVGYLIDTTPRVVITREGLGP